ncbi:MAG TPA: hypothetical protein PLL94_03810 [Bacteroidales bacterium]|nr:MAG: hypothetical protein BWX96_03137 [Bacteroidetes bacterium ADurb.Bin145]HOU31393.1 hypothetical protein [Bacteroidales bacterium]HQK67247.1 hypothetical protein [Bacteroidales bacterium]
MKNPKFLIAVVVLLFEINLLNLQAQEQEVQNQKFNVNVDLYSNYIWRGSKLGTGPAVQPSVKFSSGGLTIGVWGSFDADGYTEADPYFSYSFPFGLSLGMTDYYLPDLPLFETSAASGSHALEMNGGFTKGGFSLSANIILNEAGGIASAGGDKYFQIGYAFKYVNIFAGAGDGWHTSDGEFNLCNIGIGSSKVIRITDSFSVPLTGQIIFNPDKEKLFLVAGFSF